MLYCKQSWEGEMEMSNFVTLPKNPIAEKIKKEIREKLEKESHSGENKTAAKVALEVLNLKEQVEKMIRW